MTKSIRTNKRDMLSSHIKQSLFSILITHVIVFIAVMCQFLEGQIGGLLSLIVTLIICLLHTVACCFLGNILQDISIKRTCHYFVMTAAVFFVGVLIAISIWKGIPYLLFGGWSMFYPPKFFTAFDSVRHFLYYAILINLLYAVIVSLVFTILMLLIGVINLFKRRLH